MASVISEIRCVYCAGGLLCVRERYYCVDCGERNKLPESLETELGIERSDLYSKIKSAKQGFAKKSTRVRADRPKTVVKKKATKARKRAK